jgi:acetate kinase
VREQALAGLEFLGVKPDPERNRANAPEIAAGPPRVLIIPTNEELAIAQDTVRVLREARQRGDEDPVERQVQQITSDQKAQLVILWASNQQDDLAEITRKFNNRFQSSFSVAAIRRQLRELSLLAAEEEEETTPTEKSGNKEQ